MDEKEKANTVELIRCVQLDGGSRENLQALEQATGNPNVWIIFHAMEVEGFSPEKLFNLLCGSKEIQGNKPTIFSSVQT